MLGSKFGSKPALSLIFPRWKSDKNDQYLVSRSATLSVSPETQRTLQLSNWLSEQFVLLTVLVGSCNLNHSNWSSEKQINIRQIWWSPIRKGTHELIFAFQKILRESIRGINLLNNSECYWSSCTVCFNYFWKPTHQCYHSLREIKVL